MKYYGKYMKVDSRDEFHNMNKDIIWEEDNAIRLFDYGIFTNINKEYPLYFKYKSSNDGHFCGTWYPCEKKEVINYLNEKIADLTDRINYLTNERDSLML